MNKKNLLKAVVTFLFVAFLLNAQGQQMQKMQFNLPGHGLATAKVYLPNQIRQDGLSRLPIAQRTSSCSSDSIFLNSQSAINNFAASNPGCTILRKLIIDGTGASPAITNLAGLSGITTITELLSISNTSITDLSQLTALTSIAGKLELIQNAAQTDIGLNNLNLLGGLQLRQLPALTSLGDLNHNHIDSIFGEIYIDTTALANLTGLSGIKYVAGGVKISNCPLTTLSDFNSLKNLGYLIVENNSSLSSIGLTNIDSSYGFLFANLPALTTLGPLTHKLTKKNIWTFWFINTPLLTNVWGMDSVYTAANFYFWFDHGLTSLHGLENLKGNNSGMSFWDDNNLTSLTELSGITDISWDSNLEIRNMNGLTSLNGLQNITNIEGALHVFENPLLTTLNELNPNLVIQALYDDTLRIYSNNVLAFCNTHAVCNYLSTNSKGAEIYDNASGCLSDVQVAVRCSNPSCPTPALRTWNGNDNSNWNNAGNWTPAIIPQPCDSVLIPANLTDYPSLQDSVTISYLVMEDGTTLDLSGHSFAIYGDVDIQGSTINSAGANLYMYNSENRININNSSISPNIFINNYAGSLNLFDNNFNSDKVYIESANSRTDNYSNDTTSGNHYAGDLYITRNTDRYTYMCYAGDETINGDLVIDTKGTSSGFFFANYYLQKLHLGGDFIVKSTIGDAPNTSSANIEFIDGNKSTVHVTETNGRPLRFRSFYVNKSGGKIFLDQNVSLTNESGFLTGKIISTDQNRLIFDYNASINTTSNTSWVDGPVIKEGVGNYGFTFPVGNSAVKAEFFLRNDYISSSDSVKVTFIQQNPSNFGFDVTQHNSTIDSVSKNGFWKVERFEGPMGGRQPIENAQAPRERKIGLSSDTTASGRWSEKLSSLYQLRVARWDYDQEKWLDKGTATIDISPTQAFATTVPDLDTTFSIFTLGYAPDRIPVITINPSDTTACAGQSKVIHYTLDTLMFSNNTFKVQLSDSSGSFATVQNIGQENAYDNGSITVSSPNVPYSEHYKIRIVGNQRPDTSIAMPYKIYPTPVYNPVINGSTSTCISGNAYKYWVTPAQRGVTYTWTMTNALGTMTTNKDTAFIVWTTSGNTSLQVQGSNCAGSNSASLAVTVNYPAPTAAPIINNIGRWLYSSIAAQDQHSLGYHWYKNGVLINGASNSSYYAHEAGAYTVKYYNLCGEGSASNTITFAADALSQTITFPAIPNKYYGDPPFLPTATASSGLPVSFTIISGPASIDPITNMLSILDIGTITVRASQAGNNVYDTAAYITNSFSVNPGPQSINFPTISDKDIVTTPNFTLNATASSGLAVSYSVVSGPATVSGNTVTLTGIGTVTIRATQGGNMYYQAATLVDKSFCVRASTLSHITGPNSICPATNATYSTNNITGATYTWRVAGGNTLPSNTNTVTNQWPSPGNYTLIVSAIGSCGNPSKEDSLNIVAIASVAPDVVSNMLPADGTTNLELPFTLSWVPANPLLNYTYDLYLWKASDPQPGTPYISNIAIVSKTLTVGDNLEYNVAYKWGIVAHNGSCTPASMGTIQQFTLKPLPDLQPLNVQAPATAISGNTISISWDIKNNGPGSTGSKTWTDAVFLSFDNNPNFNIPPQTNPGAWSQLEFPIRPLLITTKPNVSALSSGQQYSNSVNFTLPVNYSGHFYAYVITDYPHTNNSPMQTTTANDTATASNYVDVTLAPQPDLRVESIFTPSSTFTGSTVNLTYEVKNYGVLTPVNSNWTDKIYISNSPVFNINTAILLKKEKPNGSYYNDAIDATLPHVNEQMLANGTYTTNVPVVIPNYLTPGTYFIYVYTNATGSLYEGPNSNNNIGYNTVQVFLTPTPVLTVSSLTLPGNTFSTTQSVGINWNIKNTGFFDNIEKNKGHYGTRGANCPTGYILTDSLGWGSSYWKDKVYLSKDPVLDVSTAIYLNKFLHGGDRSTATSAGYFNDNQGSPFNNCVFDGINPSTYNINTQSVILPAMDYPTNLNITIPDTLSQGNYYVYVYSNPDKEVFEYPSVPQIKRSDVAITINRPDVVVSSIAAPPNGIGGQPVVVYYSINNNGPGAVFNHYRNDRLFVSTSNVFDNNAQEVARQTFSENLPVGTAIPYSFAYTFPPATSGNRYFYVQVNFDSSFKETNKNNNTSVAAPINITPATAVDFIVSDISVTSPFVTASNQPFKYTVTNVSPYLVSGTWTDSIYISCNPIYNPATAYYIGKRVQGGWLSGGQSYVDSFALTIPYSFLINNCFPKAVDAPAYFFVKTNADSGVYEGANFNNNVAAVSRTVRNLLPDHTVTNVSGADNGTVGRSYSVSWTVKNLGYMPAQNYYNNWSDEIYISPDPVFNNNAISISEFNESNRLNTNQSYTDTKTVTIPVVPTGDYYIYAYTNRTQSFYESDFTNNINLIQDNGNPKKIHITQPDLPDLTPVFTSVANTAALGQPLNISFQVDNIGAGVTYPNNWADYIWLSTDFIPGNGGDRMLFGKAHQGDLNPGQNYTENITTSIIPQDITPGNYILILQTNNTRNVAESNFNNNLAFAYITVYAPAPVDLTVQNIQAPGTTYLGYNMNTVQWTVYNNSGNTASGVTTDGIYLSKNTFLDSTAVLIGLNTRTMNLSPLSGNALSATPMVTGVTEGNYNLLVKADILNNITETNKENNVGVSATPVYIQVTPLPMNTLTASTLQTVPRYFRLRVPDNLIGATIMVSLTSDKPNLVSNQLYIGAGYIPSPARFDFAYNNSNYGDQQIIMSSVADSVFYIMTNCATNNPPLQNITLKAEVLPFAIVSVNTNSGGNIGNVTVKIIGSLFTNNMTAKLVKTGTTITASAVYFTNSTQVFATFNLQGQPLGVYDVILEKPDLSVTTLSNGFSIVKANNGGLLTGGGVNTGMGNGSQPGCDPGAASGLNAQLSIELVLPESAFGGWPFPIQINYNNPTNYDVPAQTRVLYSMENLPIAFTPQELNTAGTSLYLSLTEPGGPPGIIRAGGSGTITVYSKAPVSYPAHTKANFIIR
ncbi:MAG: hypothetical protein JST23_04150 [Bacteroidetes bacterium]|nr:hypothetical protein [Bacteroidota bacterium]